MVKDDKKGVYDEAGELAKKERVIPADETDSIYKEAEILGEKNKEEVDDFMADPDKK